MPKDKCLRDRLQWDMETRKTPRGEEALIGYIYLHLRLDTLYCEFAFVAATKSISAYFEEDERRSFALVSDMTRRIQITVEPFIGLPYTAPDLIVEQTIAQLNAQP